MFFGQSRTNLCSFIGLWQTVQCGLALDFAAVGAVWVTSLTKKQLKLKLHS